MENLKKKIFPVILPFMVVQDKLKIISIYNHMKGNNKIIEIIKDVLNEDFKPSTYMMFINRAEEDGYLTGMESTAQYVQDAVKKIATKWDSLHHEEQKVFRDVYYDNFLKKIGKK